MTDAEPAWKRRCVEKRIAQQALLPKDWLLDSKDLDDRLHVIDLPRTSGKLTERELAITEIDEVDELLAGMADATWSAVEVCRAFCKRATIAHQLTNCLTEILFDDALERAMELDDHLARTGETSGPLHGLPVSLKDQIKGVECTMGFASWLGHISEEDAVLVQILRRAGAVIHCRTNIPQTLLAGDTDNFVFGRTVHPINRSLTCGGSTGGEGALLAMKGSIVGVGTDIGGSIRIPSSFCGLYGIRPTMRRFPYHGARNFLHGLEAIESSAGPMARSTSSCATFMRAVLDGRPHELDPTVVGLPWREELFRLEGKTQKLNFGLLRCDGVVQPHPPIQRALDITRKALEAAGHEVFDWEPPASHFDAVMLCSEIIISVCGTLLFGYEIRLTGAQTSQEEFDTITAESGEPAHELARFLPRNAPPPSVWASHQFNIRRDQYRKAYLDAWQATSSRTSTGRPMDGLLCPVYPHVAPPHGTFGQWHGYCAIWNMMDYPSSAFPVTAVDPALDAVDSSYRPINSLDAEHWSQYSPELFKNAPVGLQLVGRRFQDEAVLGMTQVVAEALESV